MRQDRHVADNYIALFSHFIPCGVWEAVYIIEGLLKQRSDADPDTIHAAYDGGPAPNSSPNRTANSPPSIRE